MIKFKRYIIHGGITSAQQKFLDRKPEGHAVMNGAGTGKLMWIDPEAFSDDELLLIDILFTAL